MSVQAVIIMAGAVALMISTAVLVRRRLLSLRYGFGWLSVSVLGIVGAPILSAVASEVGKLGFTATGFSLGVFIVFLGLICLQLSISLSGLHRAIQDLAERGALVEDRVAMLEGRAEAGVAGAAAAARAGRDVLVVMPALNEAASVGEVVEATRALGYDVCVVDDGSTDATGALARAAGAQVLSLPVNLGVGGALRCGFRWALANGYEAVVQIDADAQHDPAEISLILGVMRDSNADMVIGSRFVEGAGDYQVHSARRFVMRTLSRRVERITGVRVLDSSSGFRAIRRPLLDRFASDYPVEYLSDSVEALIDAGRTGARVIEHPVAMSPRQMGTPSASRLAGVWHVVRVIVAMELMHKRRARAPASLPGSGAD
jgi:hypothetical protein